MRKSSIPYSVDGSISTNHSSISPWRPYNILYINRGKRIIYGYIRRSASTYQTCMSCSLIPKFPKYGRHCSLHKTWKLKGIPSPDLSQTKPLKCVKVFLLQPFPPCVPCLSIIIFSPDFSTTKGNPS